MTRLLNFVFSVAVIGFSFPAVANICSSDVVPASTLLFPFVIYDYDADGNGQTTLISITNVSSRAQIVHLEIWTDYSVPILGFNIVLTGYDLQTINIRDILRDGVLPSANTGATIWWDGTGTSNAGGTPFDDGPYSTFNSLWGGALDTYFATSGLPGPESTNGLDCDPAMWAASPNNYTDNLSQADLDIIESYLRASEHAATAYRDCGWTNTVDIPNGTWFTDQEPRPTIMYVTADVVGACNTDNPGGGSGNYYGLESGLQIANVLMGDVVYLDHSTGFSEAENVVHIEADPSITTTPAADGEMTTFYHRYHAFNPALSDFREPLPTAWAFRYINSNNRQADTWVRAWKGGTNSAVVVDLDDTATGPGGTVAGPSPAALYANCCVPYSYYAWDSDENVNSIGPGYVSLWSGNEDPDPIPVPNLFPLETQEVPIDEFFVVKDTFGNAFGWMMVIWPRSNWDGVHPDDAAYDAYQTWMSVKYKAFGRFTGAMQGLVAANYNCDQTQVLPRLGVGLYGGD